MRLTIQAAFLLFVMSAIPSCTLLVDFGTKSFLNSKIKSSLNEGQDSFISDSALANILNAHCAEKSTGICQTIQHLELAWTLSVVSLIIPVLLIAYILLLKAAAKNNQSFVYYTFGSGLIISKILLSASILMSGISTTIMTYYTPSLLVGYWSPKLQFIVIIAIGGVLFAILRSFFLKIPKIPPTLLARKTTSDQSAELWRIVSDVAKKIGAKVPDNVLVIMSQEVFVTTSELNTLDGKVNGETLVLSLPLMKILTKEELSAVIGHELAHFSGNDLYFTSKFRPVYEKLQISRYLLSRNQSVFAFPAEMFLNFYLNAFSEAENRISRQREIRADLEGAKVSGTTSMASALIKVHAFSYIWNTIEERDIPDAVKEDTMFKNLSHLFLEYWQGRTDWSAIISQSLSKSFPHPYDSHPPLSQRLLALAFEQENVEKVLQNSEINTLDFKEKDPSTEQLEEQLSYAIQYLKSEELKRMVVQKSNSDSEQVA